MKIKGREKMKIKVLDQGKLIEWDNGFYEDLEKVLVNSPEDAEKVSLSPELPAIELVIPEKFDYYPDGAVEI